MAYRMVPKRQFLDAHRHFSYVASSGFSAMSFAIRISA
jgi:hypothetical protein